MQIIRDKLVLMFPISENQKMYMKMQIRELSKLDSGFNKCESMTHYGVRLIVDDQGEIVFGYNSHDNIEMIKQPKELRIIDESIYNIFPLMSILKVKYGHIDFRDSLKLPDGWYGYEYGGFLSFRKGKAEVMGGLVIKTCDEIVS